MLIMLLEAMKTPQLLIVAAVLMDTSATSTGAVLHRRRRHSARAPATKPQATPLELNFCQVLEKNGEIENGSQWKPWKIGWKIIFKSTIWTWDENSGKKGPFVWKKMQKSSGSSRPPVSSRLLFDPGRRVSRKFSVPQIWWRIIVVLLANNHLEGHVYPIFRQTNEASHSHISICVMEEIGCILYTIVHYCTLLYTIVPYIQYQSHIKKKELPEFHPATHARHGQVVVGWFPRAGAWTIDGPPSFFGPATPMIFPMISSPEMVGQKVGIEHYRVIQAIFFTDPKEDVLQKYFCSWDTVLSINDMVSMHATHGGFFERLEKDTTTLNFIQWSLHVSCLKSGSSENVEQNAYENHSPSPKMSQILLKNSPWYKKNSISAVSNGHLAVSRFLNDFLQPLHQDFSHLRKWSSHWG